jgi:hypothetical protein
MLADIRLEKTKVTPAVVMSAAQGLIEFEGESYPENSVEFYQPLYAWLDTYTEEIKGHLAVNLRLSYFNTSSSKSVLEFLDMLQTYHNRSGGAVTVQWFYHIDDEDILESGRELCEDLDMNISFVSFGG